jgi:hypothetical protein
VADGEYACCCLAIGEKVVPTISMADAIAIIAIRTVMWFMYLFLQSVYIRDMVIVTLLYFDLSDRKWYYNQKTTGKILQQQV